ncbi:MAG: hypothetical protein U0R44_06485 [Candidatus Micrarchaeia archaeon]
MRRSSALLLVLVLFLGFGCISETRYDSKNTEQLANTQSADLDNDGSPDYLVYDYSPVSVANSGMKLQRQITVSVDSGGSFTGVNPNLTDVDLLVADQSLEEFSKSRQQADSACSANIGLSNVVCSDITTCSKLCSSASPKCRKIASSYEEALAGNMIDYVSANNQIRSLLLDARKSILDLRNSSDEQRNEFYGKLRSIVSKVAEINANPIYTDSDLGLCSHSDFGVPSITEAADKIGPHSNENSSYLYKVVISVKPVSADAGSDVGGVSVTDRMPKGSIPQSEEQLRSLQPISVSESGNDVDVVWSSSKSNREGYVLYYSFRSNDAPDTVLASLRSPDLKVRTLNLAFLAPTKALFNLVYGIGGNYYIALGTALALTLALILLAYNFLVLVFTMVSERAAGMNVTVAFRKAFGRTDVKWKTDMVVAILFIGAGVYVASTMAQQPASVPALTETLDFLLKSEWGIVAIGLVLIGVLMAYFAIENFAKITMLERVYGMVIRQEKDMFLAKAATLKDKIKELEALIEEYTKDDFDVSKEYDLLTSMKSEKIDSISKEMTARTKTVIEDNLSKVESAVSGLREKKKIADDNWPKWKESIAKMLDEQDEVYTSSLITVPSSLRSWALGRFVREEGSEGITFERDSLKKRKVTPAQLVQEMIAKGLIRGAIVLKQDKVVIAEFSEGSSTLMTALALKLNSYAQSLGKNLSLSPPQSIVTVGEKRVMVLMKSRSVDSVLFLGKDRFNEAIEQWKAKIKIFEAG